MHCPRRDVPLPVTARRRHCCPETLAGGKGDGEGQGGRTEAGPDLTQTRLVSWCLRSVPACKLPADGEGASAPRSQAGGHVAKPGGKGTGLL